MADLDTNIPQISFGQADKETAVNELFDAASPSMLFGRNGVTSAGLGFGLLGGRWNGTVVANKVLTLPDNETLYISANLSTGSATFQTGSFKTGEMPLYKVTTASGLVTNYEDHRAAYGGSGGLGDMTAAVYDPQGIEADTFDRANHTGTQLMASISDKQGKVFTDPIILSDITDLDGVVDEGLYFCDLSCGVYSGSEVRVYEIVDSVIGLARLQAVSGPGGTTQSRVYFAGAWQPFGTSVTDQQVANWYNDTTADPPNAVINSDGSFSRSINSFVPEAPANGKQYARKDANWVEVTGGGGGGSSAWADITGKPAVIGAGSNITNAQVAMGIIVSSTAPVSPAEGTIWIKVV